MPGTEKKVVTTSSVNLDGASDHDMCVGKLRLVGDVHGERWEGMQSIFSCVTGSNPVSHVLNLEN